MNLRQHRKFKQRQIRHHRSFKWAYQKFIDKITAASLKMSAALQAAYKKAREERTNEIQQTSTHP